MIVQLHSKVIQFKSGAKSFRYTYGKRLPHLRSYVWVDEFTILRRVFKIFVLNMRTLLLMDMWLMSWSAVC